MIVKHTTLAPYLVLLAAITQCVLALDRTRPAASYIRTTFTVEDGLPSNVINAILQTRNGFMWIGTDAGLARFDGRHFTAIDFRGLRATSQGVVRALANGKDGDLWIATNHGLARIPSTAPDYSYRSLSTVYHLGRSKKDEVTCLKFSRDGTLWAGTDDGLYRFKGAGLIQVIAGVGIQEIEEAPNGHLLVVAARDFLEWDGKRVVKYPGLAAELAKGYDRSYQVEPFRDVMTDRTGATWYCTAAGVARRTGDSIYRYGNYGTRNAGAVRAYEDWQDTVWVSKEPGLFRATGNWLEPVMTNTTVRAIFSDQDGELWVGTNGDGLVQFKDRSIRMYTSADGLPSNVPMTVLQRHDGSIWIGNNCGGLSWFDGKRFRTYNEKDGLANSCVWALAEDDNNALWIGTWGGGLFSFREGRFTQYSTPQGLATDVVRSIVPARDGSLWIATPEGLSVMRNGRFRNYTMADGLSSNRVFAVHQDSRGVIWAGTGSGIDRLVGDRFVSLSSQHEIFDDRYMSIGEGPVGGDVYALSAPKGISRIEGDRLVEVSSDLDLMSIAEFQRRDLWFTGGNGIFRIALTDMSGLSPDRSEPLDYSFFGKADGLNSPQCSIGAPNMAITRDGKLWVATVQGLAQLDLPRLSRAKRAPAIFVEEVTVGQKKQSVRNGLELPPGTHHLEVKFDSIEFISPEKIRFQYKLDGVDGTWLDAGTTRTAVYTSIPVGVHSFHIRACNRDGVWNRNGIVYNITQRPFFYETNVFRLAVFAGVSFLLGALYRYRLHQIAREFRLRIEERVNERTRIARELHDTLLQSFQGSLIQMQAARNAFSRRPEKAVRTLDDAINMAEGAIGESRDAIQDLRSQPTDQSDLKQLLILTGQDLAHAVEVNGNPVTFRVTVEGERQDLDPLLQDEIYRIARELLRNAFQHARARHIEADIRYDDRLFRIRIRDDGKGIDPETLKGAGLAGHWGLLGMRERAKRIGAELNFWSGPDIGTEVELRIASSAAYGATHIGSFRLFRKKKPKP